MNYRWLVAVVLWGVFVTPSADAQPIFTATDLGTLGGSYVGDSSTAGDVSYHAVLWAPSAPTSRDQCAGGGWEGFGTFKNQGDCVSFVTSKGKNPPATQP